MNDKRTLPDIYSQDFRRYYSVITAQSICPSTFLSFVFVGKLDDEEI
jgi:hypothetical protein